MRSCKTDSSQCGWECRFSRLSRRIPQKITRGGKHFCLVVFVCVCWLKQKLFFKGVASDGIHNCGRKEVETSFFRIQQNVHAKSRYETDKASRYFTLRTKDILLVYSEKKNE